MAATPTLDLTIALLRSRIQEGSFGQSGILPSIQKLAQSCGVSLVTAWKAAQALKREGLISGKRGSPLTVTSIKPATSPANTVTSSDTGFPQPKLKWRHIVALMKQDLLAGTPRPGQGLPSVKELMRRYDVSYPTLRKALAVLVDDGIVHPRASWYRVAPVGPLGAAGGRIIFITRPEALSRMFSGVLLTEFLRHLESGCRAANVTLEVITYRVVDDRPEYTRRTTGKSIVLNERDSPLGYIYMPETYDADHESVARELAGLSAPLALIDDAGVWEYPTWLLARAQARVFRIGLSGQPARVVARHLMSQGHRRVAYLSPFHAASYSQSRLEGLVAAFAEAGLRDAVAPFTIQETPSAYIASAERTATVLNLARSLERWKKSAPRPYVRQFEPFMTRILSVESAHGEIRTRMEELFEQASRVKEITAWVASNDTIAGFAVDFCADHHVKVPETVSIIGFDDSVDATNNNLTSYNLNLSSLADAALCHLLRRHNPLLQERQRIIDIEGTIAVRGSSGPAPRSTTSRSEG